MRRHRITAFPRAFPCAAVTAAVVMAASFAPAAEGGRGEASPDAKPTTAPVKPTTGPARPKFVLKYRPVVTETSSRREVGLARAGRGAEEKDPPRVYVLAPEGGVGTTTRDQPTLYWYISEPTKRKVRLSLTPVNEAGAGPRFPKPALSVELNGVEKAGVQAMDLSAARGADGAPVKLEKGGRYRWVVVVLMSETERAKNPYAGCVVARVDAPAGAADARGAEAAAAYAGAGVWYDAMAALNNAIDADPGDKSLRDARRELLASQKLIEDEGGNIREAAQPK